MEFLGWFEEPETLHIAMEYLKEGDLTKHISALAPLSQETAKIILKQLLEGLKVMHQEGITHRDIKPAVLSFPPNISLGHAPLQNTDESKNILVVSMSPVWVKIGDFGASKWIRDPDTTTLHTQVVTPSYSAPEVLGLDSNSETSDYTNSVDIWSLGCVMYELLVGAKLFDSAFEVYRYYFGTCRFPEDRLKAFYPPISDAGISLIKSMIAIQPRDRPTAAVAANLVWVKGGESDESTLSRRRKNSPAPHGGPEDGRSKRGRPTQHGAKRISGDVGSRVNRRSQRECEFAPLEAIIDASTITRLDAGSVQSPAIGTEHQKSEPISQEVLAPYSNGSKAQGKSKSLVFHKHISEVESRNENPTSI